MILKGLLDSKDHATSALSRLTLSRILQVTKERKLSSIVTASRTYLKIYHGIVGLTYNNNSINHAWFAMPLLKGFAATL